MKEPLWKLTLNWGVIIVFLTLPLFVLGVHLYALTHQNWLYREKMPEEFKYILEYERNLAILVFGLAGLRTWETVKNGHHHETGNPLHLRSDADAGRLRRGERNPAPHPEGAKEPGGEHKTQR